MMVIRTVLIVEADWSQRRLLQLNLKRIGWTVLTAITAPEAIDLARDQEVDTIIIWQSNDGMEERLRNDPVTRSIHLVVMPWDKKFEIKRYGSQTFEA